MKTLVRNFLGLASIIAFIIIFSSPAQAGGTPATSTQIELEAPVTDALSQSSRTNYYRFTLPAAGLVSLRLTHASNGSDWSYLRAIIQNADASADFLLLDSAGNATDTTRSVALPAGSYLVKVEPGWAGNDYNSYALTVSATSDAHYELEKNDTPETATPVGTGTAFTGALAPLPYGNDVDYYRFTLPAASYVTLNFKHASNGYNETFWNATIRSADGSGEYLLLDSYGTTTDSSRHVILPAGTYLVKVERGWAGTDHGSYTLTIAAVQGINFETEKNEGPESATPIAVGTWYTGIVAPLQGTGDVDYYRFTTPTSRPFLVNFKHSYSGTAERVWNIKVLDGAGQEYLSFDAAANSPDASYGTLSLTAGTPYFIKVTDYYKASLNNSYQISVTPDTAPPLATAAPAGGTYNNATSVTLACSDGTQSGCDRIHYTTDGTTPTTSSPVYTSPIALPANQASTIKFLALDLAWNSSAVRSESYFVDTVRPTTTAAPAGSAFKSATTVTLSCSDPQGSGCDKIYFTTDGSYPWASPSNLYNGPISITATTTLRYFARDLAGNEEEVQTKSIHIDPNAPSTAAPPGGVSLSDSIAWTAQTRQDPMYHQNGVISVSGTIFTIGGKIDPYATDVTSGYIMSDSGTGTWKELSDDFLFFCYISASWGQPCNSALNGVTESGTPFAVVGALGHIRTADTPSLYAASGTDNDLFGVAWWSELSRFIAVGAEGTIVTSADGSSWTVLPAVTGETLRGVASSATRVVAVGSKGTVLTSSNGTSWSSAASGTTADLLAVTWSAALAKFIAVGVNGTVLGSGDGTLWTRQDSRVFGPLYAVTASPDQLVAVGDYGVVLVSPDGVIWREQGSGTSYNLRDVTWTGTKFIAVGAEGTWITGIERESTPLTTRNVTLTCSDGDGSGCDKIYYTTDGTTPTQASTLYTGPVTISATTTVKYFAVDKAGNSEAPKSEVYSFAAGPQVAVTLAGTGGGSINSNPPGMMCTAGTCTASFPAGSNLSLLATPDSQSVFSGWGGDCSGSGNCSVAMSGDRSVTATFGRVAPVRLMGTQVKDFDALQAAYDQVPVGTQATINARAAVLAENPVLNKDVTVTLKGGYDTKYLTKTGRTTLDGKLAIRKGRLRVNGVAIK